jgi:hypothetical protein
MNPLGTEARCTYSDESQGALSTTSTQSTFLEMQQTMRFVVRALALLTSPAFFHTSLHPYAK